MVDDELRDDEATGQQSGATQHHEEAIHDGRTVGEQSLARVRLQLRGQNSREAGGGNDLTTLDRAEPPTERGQGPRADRRDQHRESGSEDEQKGKADDESEQHSRGGDDRRGEDLAGWRLSEEEDSLLQGLVDQASGGAAEDVGDGRPKEQPDNRRMGAAIDVAADLEPGQRAGQHEEETEALDEDH